MISKTDKPERLVALNAELVAVESMRRRLHGIRTYREVVPFALDEDLARRAGLAASGQPVEIPDIAEA